MRFVECFYEQGSYSFVFFTADNERYDYKWYKGIKGSILIEESDLIKELDFAKRRYFNSKL
jgi:hypothetical protein